MSQCVATRTASPRASRLGSEGRKGLWRWSCCYLYHSLSLSPSPLFLSLFPIPSICCLPLPSPPPSVLYLNDILISFPTVISLYSFPSLFSGPLYLHAVLVFRESFLVCASFLHRYRLIAFVFASLLQHLRNKGDGDERQGNAKQCRMSLNKDKTVLIHCFLSSSSSPCYPRRFVLFSPSSIRPFFFF